MAIVPVKVQPGELITSEFMNTLIDVCADLQRRVIKLETPSVTPAGMIIGSLLPSGTKRIGEELHIIGHGFDVLQGNIVTIDGIGITPNFGVDRDRELILTIPNVQGVTAAGKTVTALVSNVKGTDMMDFLVHPAVLTVPDGQVFVNLTTPPSAAQLLAGQSYTFIYTVQAITDLDETYVVGATVSSGWAARFVDSSDSPITPAEVTLPSAPAPAGATQTLRIRVAIPGGTPGGAAGTLRVTVTSKRNPARLVGRSGGEVITANAAPPSSFPIAVTLNGVTRTIASQPSASTDATGVLRLGAGTANYRLNFGAQIKANTVYTLQITPPSDGRWSVSLLSTSATLTQNIGPVSSDTSQQVFVFVHGGAGAPDADLIVRVTSTTDATQAGRMTQMIGLLP